MPTQPDKPLADALAHIRCDRRSVRLPQFVELVPPSRRLPGCSLFVELVHNTQLVVAEKGRKDGAEGTPQAGTIVFDSAFMAYMCRSASSSTSSRVLPSDHSDTPILKLTSKSSRCFA